MRSDSLLSDIETEGTGESLKVGIPAGQKRDAGALNASSSSGSPMWGDGKKANTGSFSTVVLHVASTGRSG